MHGHPHQFEVASQVMGLAELVSLVAADVINEAEAARRAKTAEWQWDDDQILGGVEAATNASKTRQGLASVARPPHH